MGVYSMDRHQATNVPVVEADMSYYGAAGAQRILAECCQNDLAFFEGVIAGDFKTAVGLREGTILESEMQAITEGTISGFFGKLKELVKKIWAKIKGLFKNFFIKINALCTGDNKKLVAKYKKEVLNKDLSKMKFKWGKKIPGKIINLGVLPSPTSALEVKAEDETDFKEKYYGKMIETSSCSVDEFAKEAHSYMFEDEEEYEGLKDAGISVSDLIVTLTNSNDILKDAAKVQKDNDKLFSDILKSLDKDEKELINKIASKDTNAADKNAAEQDLSVLHNIQRGVNCINTLATAGVTAMINAAKYHIAQSRRVFIKAASYNPKTVKEDAMLIEACCEVSDGEIEDAIATAPTAAEKDAYDAAARDGKLDPTGDVGPQDGSI